ncbi:Phosphoglycolate phosphatase [Providencia alcalifaciens]|nr:Phosphoglycolate phosphatase [Providencia alcalifaciens]
MTHAVLESIKAIAFDLDGTLVDSAGGLADAIDKTLEELNLPPAGKERVSIWVGNGADMLVERALKWAGMTVTPERQKQARIRFDEHYATTVNTGSQLFPEVKETLETIAKHNMPMAIGDQQTDPVCGATIRKIGY